MNVFDILGPVMIGPSSSHTAGAARIGLVTRALLGKTPVKAHIFLHGSFAKTYKGHGTDKIRHWWQESWGCRPMTSAFVFPWM